ncbi:hypothetical protein JW796_01285 [Candidatus Dojkabacteria bacterium]|nr:hypothetical protein [Candidatus Dojkabacteria bacterium]
MPEKLRKVKKIKSFLLRNSLVSLTEAYNFRNKSCSEKEEKVRILLPVALTLHALSFCPSKVFTEQEHRKINSLLNYIIKKGDGKLSYNYYTGNSKSSKEVFFPDDLDDTSFCLSALLRFDKEIDERFFLKIINLEVKPGGPYNTWYVSKREKDNRWQDIDPIVNANLLYMISLYGVRLKSSEKYLLGCLKKGMFNSPYYPYSIIFILFLSRFANKSKNDKFTAVLVKELLKYKYTKLEPMEKIFYLLASVYLGVSIEQENIDEVLFWQNSDGSFPPLPFRFNMQQSTKRKAFTGSSVITSALVLELLLLTIDQTKKIIPSYSMFDKKASRLIEKSRKIIAKELSVNGINRKEHDALISPGSYKILDFFFKTALCLRESLTRSQQIELMKLSIAVFFLWSGYTVIDELIDKQLSIAAIPRVNTLIRIGWSYLCRIVDFRKIKKEINKAFLDCDDVYLWEIERMRFNPEKLDFDFKKILTYRYIEKRMQPFLISISFIPQILELSKKKGVEVYRFFKAKMIIDQFNDDAHDWEDDWKAGRMTYVLYRLFKQSGSASKNGKDKNIFYKSFWSSVIDEVIKICEKEYKIARSAVRRLKLNEREFYFNELLEKAYKPIRQASKEKNRAEKFIQSL